MSALEIAIPEKLIPVFQGPADVRGAKGGRGSAKTQSFAKMLAAVGLRYGQAGITGQLVCARQFMNSLEDSSLEECKRAIESEPALAEYYEVGEKYIKSRDGRIWFTFVGLDRNLSSIKSKGRVLVVWVDEAQPVGAAAWKILGPTLREEGDNWNAELWLTWNPNLETDAVEEFCRMNDPLVKIVELNWRDNPRFPARLQRERERDLAKLSTIEYQNVWEGKHMPAVLGAIYFDQIAQSEADGRIARVAHDRLLKVHAIWDLGWNDSMSIILAQRSASEIRIVDYIEDSHKKLSDYVEMLKGEGEGHEHRKAYVWGYDWLPHDGFSKDYKTGKSAEEMLKAMGRHVARTPSMDIEGGIKAAREVFDRVWFDSTRSARLVECLKRYRRNLGQKTGEAGTPLHDEFSHGADAFRYLALCADQLKNTTAKPKRPAETNHSASWMAG